VSEGKQAVQSTDNRAVMPEVVILCGGRGTRLGPETDVTPKPLIQVAGKPILWHIMTHYASFGFRRFVLCLGYKGDEVRDYFLNFHFRNGDFTVRLGSGVPRVVQESGCGVDWEVTCAETGLSAETGSRISQVRRHLRAPYFLCTYGDGVADIDVGALVAFHKAHGRIATITGVRPPARFGELSLASSDDTRVISFKEKPQVSNGGRYINGGFFVFDHRLFDYLSDDAACNLEAGPLEQLAADDELRVFRHHGFWQCVDTARERDLLGQALQARRRTPVALAGRPAAPAAF
jgi:glucose-1-phosphate cytidylyltransferase